jgi:hypothetical protein
MNLVMKVTSKFCAKLCVCVCVCVCEQSLETVTISVIRILGKILTQTPFSDGRSEAERQKALTKDENGVVAWSWAPCPGLEMSCVPYSQKE